MFQDFGERETFLEQMYYRNEISDQCFFPVWLLWNVLEGHLENDDLHKEEILANDHFH